MNRFLAFAFLLGLLVGVTLFGGNKMTGAATSCSVENQQCACTSEDCVCGNHTIPADYCSTQSLNNKKR